MKRKPILKTVLTFAGVMPLILASVACSNGSLQMSIISTAEFSQTKNVEVTPSPSAISIETPTIEPVVTATMQNAPTEVDVRQLPLAAPLDSTKMEFSGMAWYGDKLVLLPQYPARFKVDGNPAIYAIEKQDILLAIEQKGGQPLTGKPVPFEDGGLSNSLKGFEGFESLVFDGNSVYLTIETHSGSPMMGYFVRGQVVGDLKKIVLEPETLIELPPQTSFENASNEAIAIFQGKVYTLFEDNGASVNPEPYASVINMADLSQTRLPFPSINYRITDATMVASDGTFWVLNYFYPGDTHLAVNSDPIALEFGLGPTHIESAVVERILELHITDSGIRLEQIPPIQLRLLDTETARNWEGIEYLDGYGFLLVTDSFPDTILGFVPYP